MPAVADLCTEVGKSPTLESTRTGVRGRRIFRVNTVDEGAALGAVGLPQGNDVWSATLGDLKVIRRSVEFEGGVDSPVSGTGGWSLVTVEYATDDLQVLPPQANQSYTELVPGETTLGQMYDIRYVPGLAAFKERIGNGQGAAREVHTLTVLVTQYWERTYNFQALLNGLSAIYNTINATAVTCPPLYGAYLQAQNVLFPVGTLRYRVPRMGMENNLLKVVHEMVFAPPVRPWGDVATNTPSVNGHDVQWVAEDSKGNAVGPVRVNQLYHRVSWPANLFLFT